MADCGAHAGGAHQRATIEALHFAGIELEQAHVHQDFDPRLGQGLALLQRGNAGEVFLPFQHQPRRAVEHGGALLRAGRAPQGKALRRHVQRGIQVCRIGQGSSPSTAPVAGLTTAWVRRPPRSRAGRR
jgi:hypothetical protein